MYLLACKSLLSPPYTSYILSLSPSPLQDRKVFEKIGEPTEVALKVLAEKLNLPGLDLSCLTGKQRASACFKVAQQEYKKMFTLEFSRDRKSMSVYCKSKEHEKNGPLMFVKVCGSGDTLCGDSVHVRCPLTL